MNYFYAKIPAEDGLYIDTAGVRYDLSVVRRVRDPQGVNVGYTEFPSLEAALEHWGLTPVPVPVPVPVPEEEISYSRGQENDENDLITTE